MESIEENMVLLREKMRLHEDSLIQRQKLTGAYDRVLEANLGKEKTVSMCERIENEIAETEDKINVLINEIWALFKAARKHVLTSWLSGDADGEDSGGGGDEP